MKNQILRGKLLAIILGLATIAYLSSCAASNSHYQVRGGKTTKENKKPDCINAWEP